MTKKRILLLGASRYYMQHISAAKNAGYFVLVVDRNPESPGFQLADDFAILDFSDHKKLEQYVLNQDVDAIIPLNDFGTIASATVASRLEMPHHLPIEVALNASIKRRMRSEWEKDNVNSPKLRHVSTLKEALNAASEIGFPCILKPAEDLAGGSRGVIVVQNKEDFEEAFEFTSSILKEKSVLVEEFIESTSEHSIEAVIQDGEIYVLMIGDNHKAPLPYRVNKGILYPTQLNQYLKKAVIDECKKAVKSLGIKNGIAHIELGIRKNEPILFELGSRCGGGAIPNPIAPMVTGMNEFLLLCKILTGQKINLDISETNKLIYYHFIIPDPGRIKSLNIEPMPSQIVDFEFFKKVGDDIQLATSGPLRSGFAIIEASTKQELDELIIQVNNNIEIGYEDE